MAHHVVVFVNGERFPLMDDRRFHLGAYFPEGATLYDLSYAPPQPVPMSSFDVGVTASKLRPFARYSANPPRPGVPAVVVHGVPQGVTPGQLGQFIDMCLDGACVEECNFFPTAAPAEDGAPQAVSTRAYALFGYPQMASTLVEHRNVEWPDFDAVLTFEYLDVPRPSYGRRRHRGEPPVGDPSITLAAPAKVAGSTFQQQIVSESPAMDGLPPIAYFLQLVEDNEPVLLEWCTDGICEIPMTHAKRFAEAALSSIVHIIFAIKSRREVFGFGQFMGYQPSNADPENMAIIGVNWIQYGAGVKKPEVDSCVSADVAVDVKDGTLLRPDWAFDICAAVDRTLQRPSVRAAPPMPSQQPATAVAPPPPPMQGSSSPPSNNAPPNGAWHAHHHRGRGGSSTPPPHGGHHHHHQHHHHHHSHHYGGGGGGYGGPGEYNGGGGGGYRGGYGGGGGRGGYRGRGRQ